ncbi:AGE family epimerase/isomerase [Tianweitania sp.]|uniref:AGE family epimerase/isomerase n=1 Tax=Tianweitania sp. TaxID=2021634 RepID=UPI0028A2B5ED|nr:AGE family epimerase/isomerase [Tianweitania sp.]
MDARPSDPKSTDASSERIVGFVMSGGVGSRLWPLSREDNPKQFHDLSGGGSMLLKTVKRLKVRTSGETPVYLIASERHAERVRNDLAPIDLAGGAAIFEPMGRNTAAAVAVAALRVLARHDDALVLILPSDHEISTEAQFWTTIESGVPAAKAGSLVVFGVKPTQPETGYGYIEAPGEGDEPRKVKRFVEKPNLATAERYVADGGFYWNAGIFLFKASAMRDAFARLAPEIWTKAEAALAEASDEVGGVFLPADLYADVPSDSIDYAVMERADDITMVPAGFKWSDLGSWQSLLEVSQADEKGNVKLGDVVAIDCENAYFRSHGRLLTAIGMKDVAVVSTLDATFVAPVTHSQHVKKIVEELERNGRLETRFTPTEDRIVESGAWRKRVRHWLFEETLPLWCENGVDRVHGGFHEALSFDGQPIAGRDKRVRTQARQIYAFAIAKQQGWSGNAEQLIAHGIEFLATKARTVRGGFVRTLSVDGRVIDPAEDAYDHSCVLLALAHAHAVGNPDAMRLGDATFEFLDEHLEDQRLTGFLETSEGKGLRRSNPHMHLLEAFLAWHQVTGKRAYLRRAARIVDLFRSSFFDADTWTLGEYFEDDWSRAEGEKGQWTEPGHHFEWASLLIDFAHASGQKDLIPFGRKLYASAVANGLNRATGLAYGAVSRAGLPLDRQSRSWPQSEAIKAAIALDGTDGPDLKPEIEQRVGRLFRWHIDPAPTGMWIDQIDEKGRASATEVPASIFYHLVSALTQYLDRVE